MGLDGIKVSQEDIQRYAQSYQAASGKRLDVNSAVNIQEVQRDDSGSITKGLVIKGINNSTAEDYFKVGLNDNSSKQVNTSQFEYFLNHMEGMDSNKKAELQKAINAAADTLSSTQTQGDTYALRLSQTNLAFKYVSEKMVHRFL